ncbi:sulfur carrier protein ThiS [Thiolapillus brandeum]|uniref:Thiamine biosynthesis protein ThiS n=1 Tax=Thiolapillus brandeum TaxID=1076588 RepID=A0A7U6GGT9_9GAMM|nr:sulfur carrier protein ThiS [Thiolapillus brandeum]BAO43413.1 thiamine biosynthesis protein ThiS [Thiolapillus brandeum]
MNILLNGENTRIEENATLADLIRTLHLEGSRYAVEVNEALIPRSEHHDYRLKEGDNVEIVQAIGGG